MFAVNKIYASGALRRFLDARAMGAPREELVQLSAKAMAEQEAERANRPEPQLRFEAGPDARGVVLDLDRARAERNAPGDT